MTVSEARAAQLRASKERYKAKKRAERDMWRRFVAWKRPPGMAEHIGEIYARERRAYTGE